MEIFKVCALHGVKFCGKTPATIVSKFSPQMISTKKKLKNPPTPSILQI